MTVEIVWPTTVRPESCTFRVVTRTVFSSSPMRRGRRVFGSIVEQWVVQMSFSQRGEEVWAPIDGALSLLDGPSGILRMWDSAHFIPAGVAAGLNRSNYNALGIGAPFSDDTYFSDGKGWLDASAWGAIATAQPAGSEFVTITGLVPSQDVSIAASDRFEIGGYLYKAARPAASDADGNALVNIRPRLRLPVLPGDAVKFAYPTSPFQLADDEQGGIQIDTPMFGSWGLSLVEVVP